jgi:hypothetical protein
MGATHRATVVHTRPYLRPGHPTTIWVKEFPGRGEAEATFFPTAICEDGCGAPAYPLGETDAKGQGKFVARVPNGFLKGKRQIPFRDLDRISVKVIWTGSGEEFDTGTANPEPRLLRHH